MTEETKSGGGSSREEQIATEINKLVRERVAKLDRSFKTTLIVGAIIAVVIVIYLSVLYSNFKGVVEAENLADFVSTEISRRIPEVGTKMEGHLKQEAPRIVASIKDLVVKEGLPIVRDVLQEQIVDFSKDFIGTAPQLFSEELYSKVVMYNKAGISAALAKPGAIDNPEYTASLEKKFSAEMEKQLKKEVGGDQVTEDMKQSLEALNNITKQLKKLSEKKGLSRAESLMKELISSWWTMLDAEKEAISPADAKMIKKEMETTTEEVLEGTKDLLNRDVEYK